MPWKPASANHLRFLGVISVLSYHYQLLQADYWPCAMCNIKRMLAVLPYQLLTNWPSTMRIIKNPLNLEDFWFKMVQIMAKKKRNFIDCVPWCLTWKVQISRFLIHGHQKMAKNLKLLVLYIIMIHNMKRANLKIFWNKMAFNITIAQNVVMIAN